MEEKYRFVYYDHYTFGNILDYIGNYLVDGEIYTILKYKIEGSKNTQYQMSGSFAEKFEGNYISTSETIWGMDKREIDRIMRETDPIVLFDLIKIR